MSFMLCMYNTRDGLWWRAKLSTELLSVTDGKQHTAKGLSPEVPGTHWVTQHQTLSGILTSGL